MAHPSAYGCPRTGCGGLQGARLLGRTRWVWMRAPLPLWLLGAPLFGRLRAVMNKGKLTPEGSCFSSGTAVPAAVPLALKGKRSACPRASSRQELGVSEQSTAWRGQVGLFLSQAVIGAGMIWGWPATLVLLLFCVVTVVHFAVLQVLRARCRDASPTNTTAWARSCAYT